MTPVALTPPRPREPDAPAATYDHAFQRLEAFLPLAGKTYAQKRNFDFGAGKHDGVSGLSPWLRHRLLLETDVLKSVLSRHGFNAAEKFVQEVFWRGYFKGWLERARRAHRSSPAGTGGAELLAEDLPEHPGAALDRANVHGEDARHGEDAAAPLGVF